MSRAATFSHLIALSVPVSAPIETVDTETERHGIQAVEEARILLHPTEVIPSAHMGMEGRFMRDTVAALDDVSRRMRHIRTSAAHGMVEVIPTMPSRAVLTSLEMCVDRITGRWGMTK